MSTGRHRSRPQHVPDSHLEKTQKHKHKHRARSREWTQPEPWTVWKRCDT